MASAWPALSAADRPRFSGKDDGPDGHAVGPRSQRPAALPSTSPSRTTTTSKSSWVWRSRQPRRTGSRSAPPREGTTTETAGLIGAPSWPAASQQGDLLADGAQRRDVASGQAAAGVPRQVGGGGRAQGGLQPSTPAPLVGVRQTGLHQPLAALRGVARAATGVDGGRLGEHDRRQPPLTEPPLEVDLLGVHVEALVEAAHGAEVGGRHQDRGRRPPSRRRPRCRARRRRGRRRGGGRRCRRHRASGTSHSVTWWRTRGK